MEFNEFKAKLEYDNRVEIQKSYYKKNNQWNTSRCRIDICFWVDMIFNAITTDETRNDINEFYLSKTRNITFNLKEYRNSHNMDINAIWEWLGMDKEFKLSIEEQACHKKYYDFIIRYVNEKIDSRNYKDKFSSGWSEFIQTSIPYSESIKNKKKYEEIISNICNNNRWISISDDCWKTSLNKNAFEEENSEIRNQNQFSPNVLEESETIGLHGEQIVNKYLKSKYEPDGWDIQWVSSINPYNHYDFKMVKGDDTIYIEVKSTKSKIMNRFYISNNEYAFYLKNASKYKLILLSNIYEARPDKAVSIFDPGNIKIAISDKCNVEKKEDQYIFSIMSNQFIWQNR